MPVFEYNALTETGEMARGVIDADTAKEARDKLRAKKIHVTNMVEIGRAKPSGAGGAGSKLFDFTPFLARRHWNEVTLITRQFATLLKAGIPPAEALGALIQQIENERLERIFRQIKEDVTAGSTIADAFARHPHYFNDLYVNMIRAGQASGNLDEVLSRLSDYMQKVARLKGRLQAALTYPAVMALAGLCVVIFLMTYVVPKITRVIVERKATLPMPTTVLIGVSNFIRTAWPFLLLGTIGAYVAYQLFVRTEGGRLLRDTWLLRLPVVGQLFKKQAVSRFTTTFATLLRSGLPAIECLKILRTVVDNQLLAVTIDEVREAIVQGADIATPLKRSGVFPPVVGYMVAVGEQSGQLEDILERIAEAYDEEIDVATQRVTAMIEPVIIITMAGVVGFIVMAVILPLVQGFNV